MRQLESRIDEEIARDSTPLGAVSESNATVIPVKGWSFDSPSRTEPEIVSPKRRRRKRKN